MADTVFAATQYAANGTTYQFADLTLEQYEEFGAWLERQAWAAVVRAGKFLTPDEYAEQLDRVRDAAATGHYAFGSKAYADASKHVPGMKEIARLSLQKHHAGADEELVDRLFKDDVKGMIGVVAKVLGGA